MKTKLKFIINKATFFAHFVFSAFYSNSAKAEWVEIHCLGSTDSSFFLYRKMQLQFCNAKAVSGGFKSENISSGTVTTFGLNFMSASTYDDKISQAPMSFHCWRTENTNTFLIVEVALALIGKIQGGFVCFD